MKKQTLSKSNFELWLLVGLASHSITLVRNKELNPYHIAAQQLHVLRTIQELGSKAMLSEIAKQVERKIHVISRQTVNLEKEGLIRRVKNDSKSKLLRLELTEKGLDIVNLCRRSKSIDFIFSFLSEEERQQMKSILKQILIRVKECTPA